jgi:O-methyltransferase
MSVLKHQSDVVACYSGTPADENAFGVPVISDIQKFVALDAELVVLALRDVVAARRRLIQAGEAADKILSFYNSGDAELLKTVQHDTRRLNQLLNLDVRPPAISSMWVHPDAKHDFDSFDWGRNTAFELMADQISAKNLGGACAELGVYKGDQARIIGKLFPHKILYLFDTFEGFAPADLAVETAGFSVSTSQDFANTSLDEILPKIDNHDRLRVKRGFFPDSAADLEDEFCFVSLDVDLYSPTLAGLEYFYPRLLRGGAIFVHDYNNARYRGVRVAVDEFIERTGCPAVPIPDSAGSMVIPK